MSMKPHWRATRPCVYLFQRFWDQGSGYRGEVEVVGEP